MEDSTFVLFLGFSAIWILLGVGSLLYYVRKKNIQVGIEGLIVILPIVIPFLLALVVGELYY